MANASRNSSRRGGPGRRTGMSLVETSIVLAIIATMAAVAAPRYASSLARYRVDAAARRVTVDLESARRHARLTSAPCTVTFDVAGDRYTVSGVADLRAGGGPYEIELWADPYAASLDAVALGPGTIISYDGYGMPDVSGTITVRVGSFTRIVGVDAATGKAAVQ